MTLPQTAPSRKPRRLGLMLPFGALLVAIMVWSVGWFWLKGEAERRMDLAAADLSKRGYSLTWQSRQVGGYPFRMDVTLTGARVSEPSGWALAAPLLKGEAYVYALDRWIAMAPEGVVLTRPGKGDLTIKGQALRASFSQFGMTPPAISVEGVKLAFAPAAGAEPYFISYAEALQLHLRPGPQNLAALLFKVDGAKLKLQGLAARATEDGPVSMTLDLEGTRMNAAKGADWPTIVRSWGAAGGVINVRKAQVTGGAALLEATSGQLHAGADGRLEGKLQARLRAVDDSNQMIAGDVTLSDAKARLGPLVIGPSPKLY